MGTTFILYTSIFIESQWGSPPESFIQKYWLVSNLPIFQNYCFFKKGPKNQQILKNSNFFLHFWWQFYRAFQWYIVCFHTFSGCWYTEGNVFAVKSQPATTVTFALTGSTTVPRVQLRVVSTLDPVIIECQVELADENWCSYLDSLLSNLTNDRVKYNMVF